MKLNNILAIKKQEEGSYSRSLSELANTFCKKQGSFRGFHKTHEAEEGYFPEESRQGTQYVAFTVDEELDWLEGTLLPKLNNIFVVEATNSVGAHKVELKVEGISLGFLTACDLMRLRGILDDNSLKNIYENIPTQESSKVWEPADDPSYSKRNIAQTKMQEGETRTTEKEEVILLDPNLRGTLPANYNPKTTVKTKTVITGHYTRQEFSGEWTLLRKAELLKRLSLLKVAVIKALQEVNDCDAIPSNLDAEKLLNYIHGDIIRSVK